MMKRLFVFLLLSAVLAAACPSAGADNFTPVCTIPTVELFNAGGLTITAGGTVLINKRIISIPVTVVNNTEKTLQLPSDPNHVEVPGSTNQLAHYKTTSSIGPVTAPIGASNNPIWINAGVPTVKRGST